MCPSSLHQANGKSNGGSVFSSLLILRTPAQLNGFNLSVWFMPNTNSYLPQPWSMRVIMMIKFGLNVFARQPSLSSQVVSASPPVIFPVNEFISLVCADKTESWAGSLLLLHFLRSHLLYGFGFWTWDSDRQLDGLWYLWSALLLQYKVSELSHTRALVRSQSSVFLFNPAFIWFLSVYVR